MTRVGRLSGALLVQTGAQLYLVGHTKVPCDWAALGLRAPDFVADRAVIALEAMRELEVAPPYLTLALEGEAAARLIAERLVVARTGLASERLWRLLTGQTGDSPRAAAGVTDVQWLAEMPAAVWQIVCDTVLSCS